MRYQAAETVMAVVRAYIKKVLAGTNKSKSLKIQIKIGVKKRAWSQEMCKEVIKEQDKDYKMRAWVKMWVKTAGKILKFLRLECAYVMHGGNYIQTCAISKVCAFSILEKMSHHWVLWACHGGMGLANLLNLLV